VAEARIPEKKARRFALQPAADCAEYRLSRRAIAVVAFLNDWSLRLMFALTATSNNIGAAITYLLFSALYTVFARPVVWLARTSAGLLRRLFHAPIRLLPPKPIRL
jgi:hypothetical protein